MSLLPRLLLAALAGGVAAGGLTWLFLAGFKTEPPEWLIMFSGPSAGLTVMHLLRPKAAQPSVTEESSKVPKQLVGKACAECDEKVRSAPDGTGCEKCGAVLHTQCAAEHRCS